jgi:hypothetical protein
MLRRKRGVAQSSYGSKTEVELANADFRFTSQSRHPAGGLACPKCADIVAKVFFG